MFAAAPLTRRSALASAVLAPTLLTACDIDPPVRASGSGTPAPTPPEDSELVASVVAAMVEAAGVVESASAVAPALSDRLASLSQAHAAHLEILVSALPEAEVPTALPDHFPSRPGPALATVERRERRLLRTLHDACVSAASGDLARVLASMSGSISQHTIALTRQGTP